MAMTDAADALAAGIRRRAGTGRIGFVSGGFDRLHAGHTRLLAAAAAAVDYLVVGVLTEDGALPGPLRLEAVRALGMVDEAHLLPCTPAAFVAALRPAVVMKGAAQAAAAHPEAASLRAHGGVLLFSAEPVELPAAALCGLRLPTAYAARHGFRPADLRDVLDRFAGLRVMVIGDLILDEYVTCEALGMSQEDPTLVVTPQASETFLGGAGIVAAHARGLGAQVRFLSVTGEDARAADAARRLADHGVAVHLFADGSRPTTLKQRFRAGGKTLLRVNQLRQHAVAEAITARIAAEAASHMPATDLLLFADFNYGCLPQPLVEACIASARQHGVMLAADSQASSQLSDIARFRGMDLVTPTEREARLALRIADGEPAALAEGLQRLAGAASVAVTLGAAGLVLRDAAGAGDALPAFNPAPLDVAGAGDSFFCTTAMALRTGAALWPAAYLGALAAGCQVARLGNRPLASQELAAILAASG